MYLLINNYLLIYSLTTLKVYLVYPTIIITADLIMFLPSFFSHYSFEYISDRYQRHCDIELAFDCFVFSFSWVTLCDHP